MRSDPHPEDLLRVDLVLGIDASAIAQVREAHPILQRGDKRRLLLAAFPHPLVSDQGIGDLGERRL